MEHKPWEPIGENKGAHLVLVLLFRALRMNQKRGKQGSHSAQVPNTILPSESDMLACSTKNCLSVPANKSGKVQLKT